MWAWLGRIAGAAASLARRVAGHSRRPPAEPWRPRRLADVGWGGSEDKSELARALGYPGGRKFRLLLVASCRRWIDGPGERVHASLDVAERFADGLAGAEELRAAELDIAAVLQGRMGSGGIPGSIHDLLDLALDATALDLEPWSPNCWGYFAFDHLAPAFIQDVWHDPSRPIAADPAWLVGYVRSLARVAYEERTPSRHLDNARLAVLSDALEEAGCTDQAILAHLRSPGPHVRGCWAVDLVLGKE